MAAGGPGDHPLSDILKFNLEVYGQELDSMVRSLNKYLTREELYAFWCKEIGSGNSPRADALESATKTLEWAKMKVLDHEPSAWFLLTHRGKLFLDANCNHSFLGYTFMIEMDQQECSNYEQHGRKYLSRLAQKIHYSAPIAKGSSSPYKGRDASKDNSELCREAIKEWKPHENQNAT